MATSPAEWVGWESESSSRPIRWFWGLYPSMILTADGRLFYDGSHVFGNGIEGIRTGAERLLAVRLLLHPRRNHPKRKKRTRGNEPGRDRQRAER